MNRQKQADLLSNLVAEASACAGNPVSPMAHAWPTQVLIEGEEV